MIPRLLEAERLIMELRARLAALEQRVAEVSQSTGKVWGAVGSAGSGGGGAGAYVCLSIPAIPGGGMGTADVFTVVGGATVTETAGATIYNEYNSATTAGRVCTLAKCPDGSFIILGQSCA